MPPAAWYPDPTGAHELRWWDGEGWTDHVADRGAASTAPPAQGAARPGNATPPAPPRPGGGSVLTEPILVVEQLAGRADPTFTTTFSDASRHPLATATQQPASPLFPGRRACLLLASVDGRPLLACELRDPRLRGGPCLVRDGEGVEVGHVGKGEGGGRSLALWGTEGQVGSLVEHPFSRPAMLVLDAAGRELARMADMPETPLHWTMAHLSHVGTLHVTGPLEGELGLLALAAVVYAL